MKKSTLIENFYFLLAILPSALIITLWHNLNKEMPISDGAEYWSVATNVYNFIAQNGFDRFYEIYSIRTWKPIIFPQLSSILLLISQGNTLFMVGATHFLCNFLMAFWLYNLFRIYTNRSYAVIFTIFCTIIPGLIHFGQIFYADLAFYSLGTGVAYHLIKSDYFKNKTHSILFGVVFAIALCVRPAETLIIFAAPLLLYYYQICTRNEKFYNITALLLILSTFFSAVVAFYFFNDWETEQLYHTPKGRYFCVITSVLFFAIVIFYSIKKQSDYFLKSLCISLFFTFFWWADYITQLYRWAFACTVGELAQASTVDSHRGEIFWHVHQYVKEIGNLQIYTSLILMLLSVAIFITQKKGVKKLQQLLKKSFSEPTFYVCFTSFILIAIVVSPMLDVFDSRRGMASYILFLAGALLLTHELSHKNKFLFYFNFTTIAAISALQVFFIIARILGSDPANEKLNKITNSSAILPPSQYSYAKIALEWIYSEITDCSEVQPCEVYAVTESSNPFTMIIFNDTVYQNKAIQLKQVYMTNEKDGDKAIKDLANSKNDVYVVIEMNKNIKEYNAANTPNYFHQILANSYLAKTYSQNGMYEPKPSAVLSIPNRETIILKLKK